MRFKDFVKINFYLLIPLILVLFSVLFFLLNFYCFGFTFLLSFAIALVLSTIYFEIIFTRVKKELDYSPRRFTILEDYTILLSTKDWIGIGKEAKEKWLLKFGSEATKSFYIYFVILIFIIILSFAISNYINNFFGNTFACF